MFKHILVATDGSEHSQSAARYAISIAKKYGAEIRALSVVDIKLLEGPFLRDLSASVAIDPGANYQRNIVAILEKRGQAALDAVQQLCAEASVECDARLVTGTVSRSIRENARMADLLVIGQHGEHAEWADGLMGSTVDSVVRRAERPVLVAGVTYKKFTRVLAAYGGSDASVKALHTAATLCAEWPLPITVATAGSDKDKALRLLDEARDYLDTYKLNARFELVKGDAAEGIVECTRECRADLVVMGAYGHSRVRTMLLGNTTSRVVRNSPVPVLLNR